MKNKQWIFGLGALIILIVIFAVSNYVSKNTNPDSQSVINNIFKSLNSVTSYHIKETDQSTVQLKISGQPQPTQAGNVSIDDTADIKDNEEHLLVVVANNTLASTSINITHTSEAYLFNGFSYSKIATTPQQITSMAWTKLANNQPVGQSLKNLITIFQGSQVVSVTSSQLNGEDVYILQLKYTNTNSTRNITAYISKSDFLPIKMLSQVIQNSNVSSSITNVDSEFVSFNQGVNISLPSDIKN